MKTFWKDTLLGTLVLIPILVLGVLYEWMGDVIQRTIAPMKPFMPPAIAANDWFSAAVVLGLGVAALFVLGLVLRSSVGRFLHSKIEQKVLIPYAPGYRFVVESIKPFMPSTQKKPFKHAVIAYPFGSDSFIVGFITDEHQTQLVEHFRNDHIITVYNPTAPVPTSGLIYHLPASQVRLLEGVTIDEALGPIIGCGVGMAALFEKHEQSHRVRVASAQAQTEPASAA